MSQTRGIACRACGEPLGDTDFATCNNCHERYHLRLRNDSDGKDCGEVWINEQYLSLEFACFPCLGLGPGSAEPAVGSGH